jgi:hypothetical protein
LIITFNLVVSIADPPNMKECKIVAKNENPGPHDSPRDADFVAKDVLKPATRIGAHVEYTILLIFLRHLSTYR